jgi:hypothetical protein
MKQNVKLGMAVLFSAAALAGCTPKKEMVKPEATPAAATTSAAEPAAMASKGSYVVKKGDSLWKISGKEDVMGDSFRWPLLFKANRDQIQDPDLIDPKLDLTYDKQYSEEQVSDAVKKAKETPKFRPHAAPRKVLPLKY